MYCIIKNNHKNIIASQKHNFIIIEAVKPEKYNLFSSLSVTAYCIEAHIYTCIQAASAALLHVS